MTMPNPTTRPNKRRRTTLQLPGAAATIPDDLLISEVFVRLPVKSLARVKCVCQSWRAAVVDPGFVRRHLEVSRGKSRPSLLVIPCPDDPDDDTSESKDVISFHRLALDATRNADLALMYQKALQAEDRTTTKAIIPTHCDGLVALSTSSGKVFVCNPATKEFVALPPGSDGPQVLGKTAAAIAYDSWRDRYVVVRYFYRTYHDYQEPDTGERGLQYNIGHEIFTLGGDSDSWAPTANPPHAIGSASPVCTRDAVYWCTQEHYGQNVLLRFGLRDRAFQVVPCPPGTSFDYGGYNVAELDGGNKLCYVDANVETSAYDVWVADDDIGPRMEWSLCCRIGFDLFGRPGVGEEALFPVAIAGDEMILAADYKQVYSYDARQKNVKQVVDLEEEMACDPPDGTPCFLMYHVVPYVESLVSISARS